MEEQKSTREQTLYVEGMHCASCEIIIEKKLLKIDGVRVVDASLKDSEAHLTVDADTTLDINTINHELAGLGYRLSKRPVEKKVYPLFSKDSKGNRKLNKDTAKRYLLNLGIALGVLIAFFIVEKAQLGRYISVDQNAALGAFFLLGLVASVSSCAALIGGVLLSLSKHWHEQYGTTSESKTRMKPHLMFHGGRIASFFILGGILGAIGDAISLDNITVFAIIVIIISVIMLLISLQMLGVSWAQRFAIRMPKVFTRMAAKDRSSPSFAMPFAAGAMTFFLPCGFTLIAQGAALASGNPITGAYIMAFFAIGTLPVLAGISFSGYRFTSKPHLAARFSLVAGILILFFAIYNINGQLNVLGLPSLSDTALLKQDYSHIANKKPTPLPSGEQQISLIAREFNYIPSGPTTLQAGVPTKLVVDNQGVLGCGAFIASRGLFAGYVALNRGQNVIDVGSPAKGSYKVTCSMGMVPPVTIKFE